MSVDGRPSVFEGEDEARGRMTAGVQANAKGAGVADGLGDTWVNEGSEIRYVVRMPTVDIFLGIEKTNESERLMYLENMVKGRIDRVFKSGCVRIEFLRYVIGTMFPSMELVGSNVPLTENEQNIILIQVFGKVTLLSKDAATQWSPQQVPFDSMERVALGISYGIADVKRVALKVLMFLKTKSFDDVWLDAIEELGGSDLEVVIPRAIARMDILLFIISPSSYQSKWQKREINEFVAKKGRKRLVLILHDVAPDNLPDWFTAVVPGDRIYLTTKNEKTLLVEIERIAWAFKGYFVDVTP